MEHGLRGLSSDFSFLPKGCCHFCDWLPDAYVSGNQLVPGKCANGADGVSLRWNQTGWQGSATHASRDCTQQSAGPKRQA